MIDVKLINTRKVIKELAISIEAAQLVNVYAFTGEMSAWMMAIDCMMEGGLTKMQARGVCKFARGKAM